MAKKQKTIAEVLLSCQVGDIVSDSQRQWEVVDLDYDGAVLARPHSWKKGIGPTFELWSCGVESVAVIPNLHRVKAT